MRSLRLCRPQANELGWKPRRVQLVDSFAGKLTGSIGLAAWERGSAVSMNPGGGRNCEVLGAGTPCVLMDTFLPRAWPAPALRRQ